MKELKGFISGVIATALVLAFIVPAYAAYQKQATLNYNDIKIKVDGEMMTPTDATGAVVQPFIIDGTTYLPVRAIANALDLSVNWDGETKTIDLMSEDQPTEDNQLTEVENMEMTVSTGYGDGILFERTGTYTGTLLNGLAHGKGRFDSQNPEGHPWYYEGDFKNGLFNGYLVFCSPDFEYKEIGTHVDGVYTPSKTDFLQSICYNYSSACNLQTESLTLIDKNQNIFPCITEEDKTTAMSLVDSELTYSSFAKNPSAHLQNLHHVQHASAKQVFEQAYYGQTYTMIIATDENWNVYKIFYLGSTEVNDGDKISFAGLPVANSYYDNLDGGTTDVVLVIGSIVDLV